MSREKPRILLVGTVCDVADKINYDFEKIRNVLEKISTVEYFLVESDSADETVEKLVELKQQNPHFEFKSLGALKQQITDRVERIRFCRNEYVKYIRENSLIRSWDYVIVADLDGMNRRLRSRNLSNSLRKMDLWDAIFANQLLGYYDIFALRCPGWVSEDLIRIANSPSSKASSGTLKGYIEKQKRRQRIIYKKMRIISPLREPIEVQSAFGGFGIYRPELFKSADYALGKNEEVDGSEHITFHNKLTASGFDLAIDPGLINNWVNEYNINKFIGVRIMRDLKRVFYSHKKRAS